METRFLPANATIYRELIKAVVIYSRRQAITITKYIAIRFTKWLGYNLLSKQQTESYLAKHLVITFPESRCVLPSVEHVARPFSFMFRQQEVVADVSHVWRYEGGGKLAILARCGLLRIGNRLLNTDYWNHHELKEMIFPKSRRPLKAHVLIAPWGHYFDGGLFVGYYDFMMLIAAKICRIKESVSDEVFREAVISYPLVYASYEKEFLSLMGFGTDRIFDSRNVQIHADISYLGNHSNWMHQNIADVLLLKKHLEPLIRSPRTARNRVYISRAGRRRIVNEAALLSLLNEYNFIIVEDKPRGLAEQYAIYHNASFIIGPHGASFTNLLWCEAGTHLLELFAPAYAPPHFLYLAEVLGLRYSAYCQEPDVSTDLKAIADDITVSIPDLSQSLARLLDAKPSRFRHVVDPLAISNLKDTLATTSRGVLVFQAVRNSSETLHNLSLILISHQAALGLGVPIRDMLGRSFDQLFPYLVETHQANPYCQVIDTAVPTLIARQYPRPAHVWRDILAVKREDCLVITYDV